MNSLYDILSDFTFESLFDDASINTDGVILTEYARNIKSGAEFEDWVRELHGKLESNYKSDNITKQGIIILSGRRGSAVYVINGKGKSYRIKFSPDNNCVYSFIQHGRLSHLKDLCQGRIYGYMFNTYDSISTYPMKSSDPMFKSLMQLAEEIQ